MKSIIFDTGPIISLATNNLLSVFKKLKESFNGEFYITTAVKKEVIERPLDSKRYKFEALQVLKQYQDGVFKLYDATQLKEKTEKLMFLASFISMSKAPINDKTVDDDLSIHEPHKHLRHRKLKKQIHP